MRCDSCPKKLFVKLVLSGLPSGWTCGICLVRLLSLLFNLFDDGCIMTEIAMLWWDKFLHLLPKWMVLFSRKRHLAAICDANRYGKLPRLVGQVSDQLPGEACILCEILYVSTMNYEIQERGACYFPEAWIGPHVLVRMEARSIKSKQFGLLSRPALLKFEVYHGSMSERV